MAHPIKSSLLEKYDIAAPRYTSYPTAPYFHDKYTASDYLQHCRQANEALLPRDLSIYIHIPFCHSLCYFCGCNKIITQSTNPKVDSYVDALITEIELKSSLFDADRKVRQIHFGGGTPNFLSTARLNDIIEKISSRFHLSVPSQIEISIEVDPRVITAEDIKALVNIGFNRFSVGVQDFSQTVQKAVNRIQSEQQTIEVIQAACELSNSVNVDLITGLPKQQVDGFQLTLERIVSSGATRISAFNFAYLPQKIKAQRLINPSDLPSIRERWAIVAKTREILTNEGFIHIGMDHFAKAEDSLAIAYQAQSLQRNFQGYTTHKETDLIGFGVGAISQFKNAYAKNSDSLPEYQSMLDADLLPIKSGYSLNDHEVLRARLIQNIMTRDQIELLDTGVDINTKTKASKNNRKNLFHYEMQQLLPYIEDQLIRPTERGFEITQLGHSFRRQIASVFDTFFNANEANVDLEGNVIRFSSAL